MTHGTVSGYVHHRCRCSECREAWRVYIGERRREWKAIGEAMTDCEDCDKGAPVLLGPSGKCESCGVKIKTGEPYHRDSPEGDGCVWHHDVEPCMTNQRHRRERHARKAPHEVGSCMQADATLDQFRNEVMFLNEELATASARIADLAGGVVVRTCRAPANMCSEAVVLTFVDERQTPRDEKSFCAKHAVGAAMVWLEHAKFAQKEARQIVAPEVPESHLDERDYEDRFGMTTTEVRRATGGPT